MAAGNMQHLSRSEVIGLVFRFTLFGALTYFGVKWMVNTLDPTRKQKVESKKRAERIMSRIGVTGVKLTEYELAIAANLVDPTQVSVSWTDIAGLESVIQEMKETVILPIQKKELFAGSQLIQPPKGVLLHGPPGCGKTLIAKATAREAGARFINLDVAALTDKWYGESQKLAAAVFTLGLKIQPTIIFIDEIDSFLRSRDSHDHEATAMMKAQFMSLWDGLATDKSSLVIVMGATNRPQDVDKAILRRMPAMFHVGLPNIHQRRQILKLIMSAEMVADDINYQQLARQTDGFSGSDLREVCRTAAVFRIREYIQHQDGSKHITRSGSTEETETYHDALRPIYMDDFSTALAKMKASKLEVTGILRLDVT